MNEYVNSALRRNKWRLKGERMAASFAAAATAYEKRRKW